jgi:hypothetical protein
MGTPNTTADGLIEHGTGWSRSRGLAWSMLLVAALAALDGPVVAQLVQLDDRELRFGSVMVELPDAEYLARLSIDPQIRAEVERLGDASFAAREEAMAHLLEAEFDRHQLYAMLEREPLSTEQRYRVLAVIRERLMNAPRGALGISADGFANARGGDAQGVRVGDLIPGLPAIEVLKIGDRITHIDEMPLRHMGELQVIVQSRRPGERVALTIERPRLDGQGQVILDANHQVTIDTIRIEMELGSADLLRTARGGGPIVSRVETERRVEAGKVSDRYLPQPRPIEVRGGAEALLSTTQRQASAAKVSEQLDHYEGLSIDDYPALRQLMFQRQLIESGDLPETQHLRQSWQDQLAKLKQLAQQPDLSDDHRQFLNRVIRRYSELIQ